MAICEVVDEQLLTNFDFIMAHFLPDCNASLSERGFSAEMAVTAYFALRTRLEMRH